MSAPQPDAISPHNQRCDEVVLEKVDQEAPTAPSKPLLKSYDNLEWMHSRGARLLRIMAEFMETGDKLKANNVVGSLLFFGSARIRSPEQWQAETSSLREAIASPDVTKEAREELSKKLEVLERQKDLTIYHTKTTELARRLTEWFMTSEAENVVRRSLAKVPFFFEKTSGKYQRRSSDEKSSGVVVCTGGGPGMMEAANKGAAMVGGGRSMGMGISLPFEATLNPYVTEELAFQYHYFFTRKFWMAYMAMGVVATPGGVGTLDELMEIMTLRQTGRFKTKIPIVLFGEAFWRQAINFDFLRNQGVISDADYDNLFWTDDVEDAFQYIRSTLVADKNAYPGPKDKH